MKWIVMLVTSLCLNSFAIAKTKEQKVTRKPNSNLFDCCYCEKDSKYKSKLALWPVKVYDGCQLDHIGAWDDKKASEHPLAASLTSDGDCIAVAKLFCSAYGGLDIE